MNTIITETRITLNSGFFSQNIVILSFQVSNNFMETILKERISTLKEVIENINSFTISHYQYCRQIQVYQQWLRRFYICKNQRKVSYQGLVLHLSSPLNTKSPFLFLFYLSAQFSTTTLPNTIFIQF